MLFSDEKLRSSGILIFCGQLRYILRHFGNPLAHQIRNFLDFPEKSRENLPASKKYLFWLDFLKEMAPLFINLQKIHMAYGTKEASNIFLKFMASDHAKSVFSKRY